MIARTRVLRNLCKIVPHGGGGAWYDGTTEPYVPSRWEQRTSRKLESNNRVSPQPSSPRLPGGSRKRAMILRRLPCRADSAVIWRVVRPAQRNGRAGIPREQAGDGPRMGTGPPENFRKLIRTSGEVCQFPRFPSRWRLGCDGNILDPFWIHLGNHLDPFWQPTDNHLATTSATNSRISIRLHSPKGAWKALERHARPGFPGRLEIFGHLGGGKFRAGTTQH